MRINLFHVKTKSISEFDIILFFRQFSTLIAAGVPIIRSCDALIKSQQNNEIRRLLQQLKSHLLSGKNLHTYLLRHPDYFNPFVCHLIRISEHTGQLDVMLQNVANYLENQYLFKKKIYQALFYPIVILMMGLLTTLGMLIYIIPHFEELFSENIATLPLATHLLFSFSHFLNNHLMIIFLALLFPVFMPARKQTATRIKHCLLHLSGRLAIIRTCKMQLGFARFARNLGMTLHAGLPIIEALQLSIEAAGYEPLTYLTPPLIIKMNAGISLHQAMGNAFPPLMTQLIETGEETGELPTMLSKIADMYESDANHLIARLTQLLEPLIMVGLGALIGGMVLSLYLPIFNLGNTF